MPFEPLQGSRNMELDATVPPSSRHSPRSLHSPKQSTRDDSERRFLPTESTHDDKLPPVAMRGSTHEREDISSVTNITMKTTTNLSIIDKKNDKWSVNASPASPQSPRSPRRAFYEEIPASMSIKVPSKSSGHESFDSVDWR